MDANTSFFVLVSLIALPGTIGMVLLIVGYIYVMPASFSYGVRWGFVTCAPIIITAFYMGLRALLPKSKIIAMTLLGGAETIPEHTLSSWPEDSKFIAVALLLISLIGPIVFCARFWRDQRKPGLQMLIGALVLLTVIPVLYFGQGVIKQYVEEMAEKERQEQQEKQNQIQQQDGAGRQPDPVPLLPGQPLQEGTQQSAPDAPQ